MCHTSPLTLHSLCHSYLLTVSAAPEQRNLFTSPVEETSLFKHMPNGSWTKELRNSRNTAYFSKHSTNTAVFPNEEHPNEVSLLAVDVAVWHRKATEGGQAGQFQATFTFSNFQGSSGKSVYSFWTNLIPCFDMISHLWREQMCSAVTISRH